jgi:hypothetical protein
MQKIKRNRYSLADIISFLLFSDRDGLQVALKNRSHNLRFTYSFMSYLYYYLILIRLSETKVTIGTKIDRTA